MYRPALCSSASPLLRTATRSTCRRFASTASSPADKPRSWKSSALRWGLVGGAVYYYNTNPVFADSIAPQTVQAPASFDDSDLPTVDSVLEEKRKQIQAKLDARKEQPSSQQPPQSQPNSSNSSDQSDTAAAAEGSPQALEDEAGQQGAFNPETGEINWDCPCLGGMAQGPCGEEFKTAFSCFVYSTEEPKGMDCIEKFQGMQECFRQYPDIYGAELADDAEDGEEGGAATSQPGVDDGTVSQKVRESQPAGTSSSAATSDKPETHSSPGVTPIGDAIPTKWEDATQANGEVDKEEKGDAAKKEASKKQ